MSRTSPSRKARLSVSELAVAQQLATAADRLPDCCFLSAAMADASEAASKRKRELSQLDVRNMELELNYQKGRVKEAEADLEAAQADYRSYSDCGDEEILQELSNEIERCLGELSGPTKRVSELERKIRSANIALKLAARRLANRSSMAAGTAPNSQEPS